MFYSFLAAAPEDLRSRRDARGRVLYVLEKLGVPDALIWEMNTVISHLMSEAQVSWSLPFIALRS